MTPESTTNFYLNIIRQPSSTQDDYSGVIIMVIVMLFIIFLLTASYYTESKKQHKIQHQQQDLQYAQLELLLVTLKTQENPTSSIKDLILSTEEKLLAIKNERNKKFSVNILGIKFS